MTIQNGYRMVGCRRCGLVYANPRPTPEILLDLYDGYHQRDSKDEHIWERLMAPNFVEASAQLNRMFPKKGRLLDIGCGYGHFIEMMRTQGWLASGIEPSEKTSAYALSKGADIIRTVIEDASFPENSFDAITAFYVLEHLLDPLAVLIKIRAMLKPGGALVIRVPHSTPVVKLLQSIGIKNNLYDLPFHLYDFSPVTIRRLLEKAGFADIKVTPGRPTVPPHWTERLVALVSGMAARFLYALSGNRLLMPGVSKTIIASKPVTGQEVSHD
ncbi:MAG: class I SAM-dependent methyltransferase [Dissulfurispiraceae bacterium]